MIKRIIEIGNPSRLRYKDRQLIIEQGGKEAGTIPLEDVGVLILDHPQITHTQSVFAGCCENNTVVVISDKRHLPSSILLPLTGGNLHSKTVSQQARAGPAVKKKLWKEIVQAKLKAQAFVLDEFTPDSSSVSNLIEKVRGGDPDNIEGLAAKIYWKKLFGSDFRRDPEKEGVNTLLNYGYAIIRAAVARAIVGTGLHPALGVHHHSQYDSLCLADDLMEPLRPSVDRIVYRIHLEKDTEPDLDKETKPQILFVLTESFKVINQNLPLIPALHHYAASVRKILCGEGKRVVFPKMCKASK